MAKLATCVCGEYGSVNVAGPGYGRTFTRGVVVDLDAPVTPGSDRTWGEAIGAYAHLFESTEPAQRERPADVDEALVSEETGASS